MIQDPASHPKKEFVVFSRTIITGILINSRKDSNLLISGLSSSLSLCSYVQSENI